jgi:DNA-binding NtrC family response regulator
MVLRVPPLTERLDDIPMLVEHFIRRARPDRSTPVTPAAMHLFQELPWPGNVRELKQVVETALVFSREVLDLDALDIVLAQRAGKTQVHTPQFIERQRLVTLLATSDWDTELAASKLGVHRATIYRRMRRHGITVPSSSGDALIEMPITSLVPPIGRFAPVCGDLRPHEATRAHATA